ncbi:MAG TPA: tripartite tricarboxylate transporter substrate binding protein [Pseudolabrys sp.]|nr:tripartite tricarboxylate transporter substrate binding protein [Pseudolabrys sp.]
MSLIRRTMGFALLAALLFTAALPALAEDYPDKPVRVIVPYPAGGGTDIAARLIAQKLSEKLHQQFFVDNRSGANGNLGTELIAKAAPDGYVIGMATPGPVTVGRSLYTDLRYDPAKDFAPIILANESPIVLVVNPKLAATSLQDVVRLAKAKPGKLTAALVSTGSVPHLVTEMLKSAAGIDILDVPYKGGAPATLDVMTGQVDMLFSVLPLVIGNINAGQLRAIAVASPARSPLLPHVPTTAEAGYPQVVGSAWNGIVAPAGTPNAVIGKLNAEITEILKQPDTQRQFATLGMQGIGGSANDFAQFEVAEAKKWADVIKAAGLKPQ